VTEAGHPLVSFAEVLFMHTVMIDRYGGGIGVRDHGLVESALHRPISAFGGRLRYRTPFRRAAVLWLGMVKNHGFVDANKRTATMATQLWLEREGFALEARDEDLVAQALAVADDLVSLDELAAWLESRARRPPNGQ
jgi:death-on-curing protein